MDIKFDKKSGRILSCTIEGKIAKTGEVLTVDETMLPEDFIAMFPLGKYLVKKGEIIENPKFVMPEKRLRDRAKEI